LDLSTSAVDNGVDLTAVLSQLGGSSADYDISNAGLAARLDLERDRVGIIARKEARDFRGFQEVTGAHDHFGS